MHRPRASGATTKLKAVRGEDRLAGLDRCEQVFLARYENAICPSHQAALGTDPTKLVECQVQIASGASTRGQDPSRRPRSTTVTLVRLAEHCPKLPHDIAVSVVVVDYDR
jgi:hypothetical protein